jgi:serine/threonine protein phosphatase 1
MRFKMLDYKRTPLYKENEVLIMSQNFSGTDYIVGDIHGQFEQLKKTLYNIGFNENKDRLFSTGDLVDRGYNSSSAITWIEKNWFFPVMGNHDEFVLWSHYKLPEFDNERWASEMNGGKWWFNLTNNEQQKIAESLKNLPHAIEIQKDKKIGIVHADVPGDPDWSIFKDLLKERDSETMKRCKINRDRASNEDNPIIKNIDSVYFGHCSFPEAFKKGNCHYVDTGSAYETYNKESPYYREWGRISVHQI